MQMFKFWCWVYNEGGGMFKVTVTAANAYDAYQQIKGMHGDKVYSTSANMIPE